ncbi:SCAN domain-containing protein 3-like [Tachypleus tridentatus]|uniref:SCAN domain-containing protein 3-like n=1 Tax=Tachypleus tridentatus TaxID=6853 RepID=UPI003FD4F11B
MTALSNESMRPSQLKKTTTFDTSHPEKKNKPLDFFKNLRDNFERRPILKQLFTQTSQKLDKSLVASYKISKQIAKTGNAHHLDKTTLQDNNAFLMAYVRFWNRNELMEEMLFARRIKTDTRGMYIFEEVKIYLSENNIPLEDIIACAIDRAASVVGRYREFIAHLKSVIPSAFTIHFVIHREHLVAKNLEGCLNLSLLIVIKAVNFINSHALQDRLFRQLCEENDFRTLLLHISALALNFIWQIYFRNLIC